MPIEYYIDASFLGFPSQEEKDDILLDMMIDMTDILTKHYEHFSISLPGPSRKIREEIGITTETKLTVKILKEITDKFKDNIHFSSIWIRDKFGQEFMVLSRVLTAKELRSHAEQLLQERLAEKPDPICPHCSKSFKIGWRNTYCSFHCGMSFGMGKI
jgi:hypothetical protein